MRNDIAMQKITRYAGNKSLCRKRDTNQTLPSAQHLWVLWWRNLTTLHPRRRDRSPSQSSSLFVGAQGIRPIKVLVDNTSHAHLTMRSLRLGAVEPDWIFVHDVDCEDVWCFARSCGHEAAEETGFVAILDKWRARLGEGRLGEGMVGGTEVDFDQVADFCDDVFRVKVETAQAGDDGVGCAGEGLDFGRCVDCCGGRLVRGCHCGGFV